MKFHVDISVIADMSANIKVEAKSAEEAERLAIEIAKSGDVLWNYNGVRDDSDYLIISSGVS